jgi:eukaryotic-like serine/threonine-protein kinase
LPSDADDIPTSWSRDGKNILFMRFQANVRSSVWILSLADRQAKPLLQSSAFEQVAGTFSPNGRFIAYTSDESGRFEVYIQPFPLSGEKWVISSGGGYLPLWREDGKELFYVTTEGKIMSAEITRDGSFEGVISKPLFQAEIKRAPGYPYAVIADGSRFLVNTPAEAARPVSMIVVLNWTATLKRK